MATQQGTLIEEMTGAGCQRAKSRAKEEGVVVCSPLSLCLSLCLTPVLDFQDEQKVMVDFDANKTNYEITDLTGMTRIQLQIKRRVLMDEARKTKG